MQQAMIFGNLQNLMFFPLKDAESRKRLLVALGLTFLGFIVPIVPSLFVMGYAGVIMRQMIIENKEPEMPEWRDWSGYLSLGFQLFSLISIYILPAFIPMFIGYLIMIAPAFAPLVADRSDLMDMDRLLLWTFGATFVGMFFFGIGMLLGIAVWLVTPAGIGHSIAGNSFAAGMRFREIWKLFRANQGGFLVALVISLGLYMLLMIGVQLFYLTIILCVLVPLILSVMAGYLNIVIFAVFAQAYREAVMKMELNSTPSGPAENQPAQA